MTNRRQPPIGATVRLPMEPHCTHTNLSNGIPVYSAPLPGRDLITLQISARTGAARQSEPAGLAQFATDLMMHGAGGRERIRLLQSIEQVGADLDVDVQHDTIRFVLTTQPSELPVAMGLLSDILRRPHLMDRDADRVKSLLLAAALQNHADPDWLADASMRRHVFGRQSYAIPTDGTPDSIEILTTDDARAFHSSTFLPSNLFVVVAGDFQTVSVTALLEKWFGDWNSEAPIPAVSFEESAAMAESLHVIDRPGSAHAALRLGRLGIRRTDPLFAQLTLLNAIVGDSFNSRLNMRLREEMGVSYGAWSTLEGNRYAGLIGLGTSVRADRIGITIDAIKQVCREITSAPPTDEEIASARNSLIGRHAMERETTDDIADMVSDLVLYELPLDHHSRAASVWAEMTDSDLVSLAETFFNSASFVIVVAGEERTIRSGL